MITIAVLSGKPAPSKELPAKTRKFAQLAISNALLVYILMLLGSYVTGSSAAMACPGWPFCTPASWAINNHLADINILHRIFAVFVGLVMLWTVISALRAGGSRGDRQLSGWWAAFSSCARQLSAA